MDEVVDCEEVCITVPWGFVRGKYIYLCFFFLIIIYIIISNNAIELNYMYIRQMVGFQERAATAGSARMAGQRRQLRQSCAKTVPRVWQGIGCAVHRPSWSRFLIAFAIGIRLLLVLGGSRPDSQNRRALPVEEGYLIIE